MDVRDRAENQLQQSLLGRALPQEKGKTHERCREVVECLLRENH